MVENKQKFEFFSGNPIKQERGDCVLRAFTKMEEKEKTYEDVYKEMKKLSPDGDKNKHFYQNIFNIMRYAKELGYIIYDLNGKYKYQSYYKLSTVRRVAEASEIMGIDMMCITNNHAITCSEGKYHDTWDSGGKRVGYILIKDTENKLKDIIHRIDECKVVFEKKGRRVIITDIPQEKELLKFD